MNDFITAADPLKRSQGKSKKAKRQFLGRSAVFTLHGMLKNTNIHDADNEIFIEPLKNLNETIHATIAMDGFFDLSAVGTMTTLNGDLIRLDFRSLPYIRLMTNAFKALAVGGIFVGRAIDVAELKSLLRALGGSEPLGEVVEGARNIRICDYNSVVRELKKRSDNEVSKYRRVDRRTYALTLYARALHIMKAYLDKLGKGQLQSMSKPAIVGRELVDLAYGQIDDFLAMAQTRSPNLQEYLAYHSVNTLLLSVVVGLEFKLPRDHLVDLARAALFHDLGVVLSTEREILKRTGALAPSERARVAQNPLFAAKLLLKHRPMNVATLKAVLAAQEAKEPYCRLERDPKGNPMVVANDLSLHGRIIHVTSLYDALTSARPNRPAYSPQVAMGMMCGELRHELDPNVLHTFCKALAR